MNGIEEILLDERIAVRKAGPPAADGTCVVYWTQSAQRATDNPSTSSGGGK
jgi:hypothetical protein